MTQPITETALAEILLDRARTGRVICAVAGAPGSGKSTLAEGLVSELNIRAAGIADVLAMDGFHYDDTYLEPAGLRPVKGAPETFDVSGLHHTLSRLKTNQEPTVAVPVFDREIEIARAGALLINRSVQILIAEGNYLLLDQPQWVDLQAFFDVTVMVDVPEDVLRKRLRARWSGLGLNEQQIVEKLEENDLPNGHFVLKHSVEPDYVIEQTE